jgi:diacylglycerol kinase family enzyme
MIEQEQMASPETRRLDRRMIVLVNANAGEVLQRRGRPFQQKLQEGFAAVGILADVRLIKGRHLARTLRDVASLEPGAEIVVAGGDGTISRLLDDILAIRRPVGILPLGTLNLFARDLGIGGTSEEAIRNLVHADQRQIDLADINGIPFHSNAGLGFLSRMAREREGTRRHFPFSKLVGFGIALTRALLLTRPIEITIEADGLLAKEVADAVLITNNHFEGSPWTRPRLDEGLLEVHMLRAEGLRGRLAAAYAVWRGKWRELPSLRSITCRRVIVQRKGKRFSTVAMDGEVRRLRNPLTINARPLALSTLAPEPADRSS